MNPTAHQPPDRPSRERLPTGDRLRLLLLQSIHARTRMRTVESLSWRVLRGDLKLTTAALQWLARGGYFVERYIISQHHFALSRHGLACIDAGRILITSPLAQGLVGCKVGKKVKIEVPAGTMRFEVLEIKFED